MTIESKYWQISGAGQISLTYETIRPPGRGDVLIRLRAISLNYRDLLIIEDGLPEQLKAHPIPVSDGAGEIVGIGTDVTTLAVGDRVVANFFLEWRDGPYNPSYRQSALGGGTPGLAREYVVLPADSLVRIPSTMTYQQAATLPCAGVTAWNALFKGVSLTSGDSVLIQGTGGVSLYALQLAKSVAAKVIVLTSCPEREQLARQLGADETINYSQCPAWGERVLELSGGRGVRKVVEVIGNSALQQSLTALAPEGEIAYIGCLGGFEGAIDPMKLLYKNASLRGIYVGSRSDLLDLCGYLEKIRVKPWIGASFSFDELPQALSTMREKRHVGKIVVELR